MTHQLPPHVFSSIHCLTWNIADSHPSCSLSINAPPEFSQIKKHIQILNLLVKRETLPDVIMLQETDNDNQKFVKALSRIFKTKTSFQSASHCGNVRLFFNRQTFYQIPVHSFETKEPGVVLVGIGLKSNPNFYLAGVHLPPFKNNFEKRYSALEKCIQLSNNKPLIIAGDMNMRKSEVIPSKLLDVGTKLGKEKQWTWNSAINIWNPNNFAFNVRFDRIFYTPSDFLPKSLSLIGDIPFNDESDNTWYLSDHFGLHCVLDAVNPFIIPRKPLKSTQIVDLTSSTTSTTSATSTTSTTANELVSIKKPQKLQKNQQLESTLPESPTNPPEPPNPQSKFPEPVPKRRKV